MEEFIGKSNTFVKEFAKAGTGKSALNVNGKYKILTASNKYVSLGGAVTSLATGYWAKGMGFTQDRGRSIMYADEDGADEYGNNDGKVTINELYKYASPPIFEILDKQNCGKDNYPQAYPSNDNFIIYQR